MCAALHPSFLTELERDEVRADLAATVAQHRRLTADVAELRRGGEPADSPWLRKLGWQIEACVRWIGRYRAMLAEAGVV